MKLKSMVSNWNGALFSVKALTVSNVALAISIAFLAVKTFGDHERIVLTPPHTDKKMAVAWKSASSDYFKGWAVYIATLMGNITPNNANFVADQMSTFLDPKLYSKVRAEILSFANDSNFKKGRSYNFFSPTGVFFENETGVTFVTGTITDASAQFVPGQIRPEDFFQYVVYEFNFEMKNGRPMVMALDGSPGKEPHTQKWKVDHGLTGAAGEKQLAEKLKEENKKANAVAPATAMPEQKSSSATEAN